MCIRARAAYRTIIDKGHFHHGLKDSILDFLGLIATLDLAEEIMIQPLSFFSSLRPVEVGFASLLRRGQEGELRYCGLASIHGARHGGKALSNRKALRRQYPAHSVSTTSRQKKGGARRGPGCRYPSARVVVP